MLFVPGRHFMTFDESYWSARYREGQTGWDAGSITTPLKAYFDQLTDREIEILIPGAGQAHEAEYLHRRGFLKVSVLDLSRAPLENLKTRVPEWPLGRLLQGDFSSIRDAMI